MSLPPTRPETSTSLPNVVDNHAYPCVWGDGICSTSAPGTDQTNNARVYYNDVQTFLENHSLTGAWVVFGESTMTQFSRGASTDGQPPNYTGAIWAVEGYKQSSLWTLHRSMTVFQPFNVIGEFTNRYTNPGILWPYDSLHN